MFESDSAPKPRNVVRDQTSGKRSMLEQRWTQCLHSWTCIAFVRVDLELGPEKTPNWVVNPGWVIARCILKRPGSSVGSSAQRVSWTMSSPLSQFCGHCSPNVGSWECQIFRLRLEDCSTCENVSKGYGFQMFPTDFLYENMSSAPHCDPLCLGCLGSECDF